jgi:tetratricopeptide (TPR) repeat protein
MTKNFTLLLIVFSCFLSELRGQDLLPVKKSNYLNGIKERKKQYFKINDALRFYEKGLGYVDQSLALLLEANQTNDECAELNFNIGICYLTIGPKQEALHYFLKAEQLNPDVAEEIHFYIGCAYQVNHIFSKAITHFKMNIELIEQNKYKGKTHLIAMSERHIKECKNGKLALEIDAKNRVSNLGKKVNSTFDDFNPCVDGNVLYFSSRRNDEKIGRSETDQKYFERIYRSISDSEEFKLAHCENSSNDSKDNVALLSRYDSIQYIVYVSGEGNGDLYFSEKIRDRWKLKKACKFLNDPNARESSACVTDNGKTIYFISNRKEGFGECDIYYCKKNKKGKWEKPVNLGGDINTEYDEGDVFVTADGDELYFSSRGHNTIGGYDIFKCVREDNGMWSRPVNMGIPVNSADNDITFVENGSGISYFSSDRGDGLGGFDLYQAYMSIEKESEIEVEALSVVAPVVKEEQKMKYTEVVPKVVVVIPTEVIEEVKMEQKLVEEDFVYRVQIAACKKEMGPEDLFKRYKGGDVIEHLFVEGWHKYTIGGFETFDEAAKYRDSCGVSDAFVVLFKGGMRLGIAKKTGVVN